MAAASLHFMNTHAYLRSVEALDENKHCQRRMPFDSFFFFSRDGHTKQKKTTESVEKC